MKDPNETKQARLDLFNEISKTGNYGDFDSFNQALDDPQARKDLFTEISKTGNYGNFGEFDNALTFQTAQVRRAVKESEKSWWDTFLDNFRPTGEDTNRIWGDDIRKKQSYMDVALGNMPSGSNPSVGSQALFGKKMGEADILEVAKWRKDQYKDNPYASAVAEGFGRGMLQFMDSALGGFNENFLQDAEARGDKTMKRLLSPEEYKQYKDNYDNTKLVQDISAGLASSVGFLALSSGFAATSIGMKAAGLIEKGGAMMKGAGILAKAGGFATKAAGGGLGSLQALGTGAVVKSVRESVSGEKTNLFGNLVENITKAAMEGMSEQFLKGYEPAGGSRLLGTVKKSMSTFVTEALTENVSDMTEDYFNYARERDQKAVSIVGDLIKNGKIGRETLYRFMVEGLSGAIMGGAFSAFSKEHGKEGELIDESINTWVKAEPEKARQFVHNVMKSVQDKSISPELMKAMGMAGEYNRLVSYAGDNFDESQFDTDDKKAIHTQAKEVADEAMKSELMPAMNDIISKEGNANLLDAILISGKSKKDGYQLGVENQLGIKLSAKPSQINTGSVHEFTSKVLAELKTDKDISGIHEKFSKEFSPVMADDMLLGVLYPQLMPITSSKISSSAVDAQEHTRAMKTIQSQTEVLKNDPTLMTGLLEALNASVMRASQMMAKSVKTPVRITEDPAYELKAKKEREDDFLDIFGPDKIQEELDNLRAEEMMNKTEFTKEIPPEIPLNILLRKKLEPSEAPLLAEAAAEAKEEAKTEEKPDQAEGKTEGIPEEGKPVSLSQVMRKSDAEILQEGLKSGRVKEVMPEAMPEETDDLSGLTLRELKIRAKGKVKGFSKMDKTTLIESLKKLEESKKESSKVLRDESTGDSYVVQGKGIFDDIDNESDPDLLPNFDEIINTGKEIPELQDLPSNVDLNYFIQAFNKKHQLGDNSLNRLLLSISKAIGDRLTVKIVTDDKEIARLFTLKGNGGIVSSIPSAGAYLNGVIYINGKINSHTAYDARSLRRTILHEALHGLTVDMLDTKSPSFDEVFKLQINSILEEARKNINLSGITNENDRRRVEYALKNDKEFIAGIYSGSSAALVGLLDKIASPKTSVSGRMKGSPKQSLWTQTVETIKEALKNVYISAVKQSGKINVSLLDEINSTMDTFFQMLHTEAVIADKAPKDIEEKPPDLSSQYTLASIFRTKQSVTPTPLKTGETSRPKTDEKPKARPEVIATQKEEANRGEDDNDTDLPSNVEVKSSFQDNPELITLNNIQSLAQSLTRFFGGSIDGKNYNQFLNKFDFNQYMQFYDSVVSKTDERTKEARELLEKEYESKYKHSNMNFEEFTDRRLRSLWNYNKAQNEQYVLDIVYGDSPDGKIFKLIKRLGSYKTAEGRTGNTLQAPKLIEQYKDQLQELLGAEFDFFYVNGFSRDGSGELKGFHSTFDVSTADCANALYDQMDYDGTKARYIFLNVFGEKSTLPLLKLKAGEHLNLDLLDKVRNLHATALGEKYVMEATEAEKVTNAARIILEELRLGNTVENIQNYSPETAYTLGKDFARLMKRSYLVMDSQHVEQDKHLIEKLQLEDKLNRPEGISIIADDKNPGKKKIVVKSIIMDTEDIPEVNIDLGIKSPDEKGFMQPVMVPLRDLLLNAIGKQTTDGASVYVMGKFDEVYRSAFGLTKGGDIKNFINYNSMYIKHAMHGISAKDALGKWMLANDIAMITFDSAEKNGKKMGGNDRYPLVKASEIGTQLDHEKVMQIPLENFYHIKEGGRSKSEIKGFMQFVNSSGLTNVNPVLEKIDPKGRLVKAVDGIVMNIANSLNSELKDFTQDEKKIIALIQRMRTDALSNQQKRIADMLQSQLEGSDDEVTRRMRKLLDHPTLVPMIISRLNNKVMDAFKYVAPGAMPVISPDTGYATQTRINKIKGDILWDVLNEPLDSDVIKAAMPVNIKVAGTHLRDAVKMLRDMKIEQQRLKAELSESEELTDEDKQNIQDEIDESDDAQRYLYDQMVLAYKEYVAKEEKEGNRSLKPIIDTKNISFKYFLSGNSPIVAKWVDDKLSRKIDKSTGRLKEGFCMISQDVARKHGIKTGDKVVMSITPTDSLMGGNIFEVAAVLGEDISASNKVVLPSEYIQAVGKDYDVDVVSLYAHDKNFYTEDEWKALTDNNTMGKIYQEYVNHMYDLMTGDKFNLQVPEGLKKLPNWKEAFVTDEKVHLQFMQKYLGSAKQIVDGKEVEVSKDSYGMAGRDALTLGDGFRKEVAPIVNMRTLHTLLTKIGLTSKVSGYDINPKQSWFVNHIAHLIATNDRVDFPKRTNQLQYDSNPLKLEAKMYNPQLSKDYETSLAVSYANKYIFQEVIELPRGTDIMFGGGRDLSDTVEYMKTVAKKMGMLQEKADRTELIKGAKQFAENALKGKKDVSKTLVYKAIEEYIKNIKLENNRGYSAINMAEAINTDFIEDAKKGVEYDTYRSTEAKVFDWMLSRFKKVFSKSGGFNMFDEQLKGLSKVTDREGNQTYIGLDETDRRVVALVLALNSLDFKRGTTYDKTNRDRSLYLLREELVQIARPVQEKTGTKASVVTEARSRVFPSLMKLLLNQKAFIFAKGTERGDSVILKKDGKDIKLYRDQYDQLKIDYETMEKKLSSIDAQNIKNIPELSELFYGQDNLFNDSKYANENKSAFSSLVPVSSDNISSEDRTALLKDWLTSRLTNSSGSRNYSNDDLKMVFTSLLVPYQNRTLLGRFDEKQTYIRAFQKFREKLYSDTGQEPSKKQTDNYNLVIEHFNSQKKVNMEYIKRLFTDAKIPMPVLENSMNRNNLSRPFISQKGGYQSNDLVLELAHTFTPEFTEDYWDHFREFNPVDDMKTESDKMIALRSDSAETSMDFLPDFDNTSRGRWFDEAIERIEDRDAEIEKMLSKGKMAQVWEFTKMAKDNPKKAFEYLQAVSDDVDMRIALASTDNCDFALSDVVADIKQGNYEKFSRIYDSMPSRRAREMYGEMSLNNLDNSAKRMSAALYQMLKAKESFEKKGNLWFKDASNIHTFAMDYGQKTFNKFSDLRLKLCSLNAQSNPLSDMKVQPVIDAEAVFSGNNYGWVGDVQVFAYRSKIWTDQVKETMGEMNAYLTNHRKQKDKLAKQMKIETPEARAKMNRDVWDFAERSFKTDPKLHGKISFESAEGGVKVKYEGEAVDEEVLATRLYGNDPLTRYTFLSALQLRKLYDSDVPKVLRNAKTYFEEVYDQLKRMNTDVSRQNSKYLSSLIYRYDEILKAIDNPYDTKMSYMPHFIRDESQFRVQFKLLHWDTSLKAAIETRDKERKKVQANVKGADAKIASMTDKQIEDLLKQKLDEQLDNMKIDNPLIPLNANWKERIMYDNDLYTKTDDTPNINYLDNLQRSLMNDLLITDSYLYHSRAVSSKESPYVMETMRLWYGNQLTNKLLHTKPIAKAKIKPGMEITFMRQTPIVTVSNGIKSFDFQGKLVASTKNSITVELPNGSEKTHRFDAEIFSTEGYQEQMHWGKVANVTKDIVFLRTGETT